MILRSLLLCGGLLAGVGLTLAVHGVCFFTEIRWAILFVVFERMHVQTAKAPRNFSDLRSLRCAGVFMLGAQGGVLAQVN